MRKDTSEWSVRMLADFKSRIEVDDEFQRGLVWSAAQQALLIDSILRGFDIPKIYLRKLPDGSPHLFSVIDGKQRLTAIWEFLNDDLPLLKKVDPFPDFGDLGGKQWSGLPDAARDKLQFANLTVSKIEDATSDEVRELFLRLQEGEPLNAAEKRNAGSGPVRDFVAERLAAHPVWPKTGIREFRFGWDEHSAIVLALAWYGGPTGLKGADLQKLYENEQFDSTGSEATRALGILDTLRKMSEYKPRCLRTRWTIVDLSVALMRLTRDDRMVAPETLVAFLERFEKERRAVSQAVSDLQTRAVERSAGGGLPAEEVESAQIAEDTLRYYMAFAREGANKENVEVRSQIMYAKLLAFLDAEPCR